MRLFLALLLAAATAAQADTFTADASLPGIDAGDCATLACRPGGNSVTLALQDGNSVTFTVPRSPYVTRDGRIVIYPGEALLFDFPQASGDALGPPHYLGPAIKQKDILTPPVAGAITLSLELKQQDMGSVHPTFFNLQHFAARTMIADVQIGFLSPHGVVQKPMVCNLMPKLWDNESWPGGLGPIVLSNFRYGAESSDGNVVVGIGCD